MLHAVNVQCYKGSPPRDDTGELHHGCLSCHPLRDRRRWHMTMPARLHTRRGTFGKDCMKNQPCGQHFEPTAAYSRPKERLSCRTFVCPGSGLGAQPHPWIWAFHEVIGSGCSVHNVPLQETREATELRTGAWASTHGENTCLVIQQ